MFSPEETSAGSRVAQGGSSESISESEFETLIIRANERITARGAGDDVVLMSWVDTPLGQMAIGATERGIVLLEFMDQPRLGNQLARLGKRTGSSFQPGSNEHTRRLETELAKYFDGSLREFETPLLTYGTEFQDLVWQSLRRIPYGETRSYAEQARMIGAPKAVRAVAAANGNNRIAIVIPCHRVIGVDGRLTGYGGGVWRKEWLLRHERSRRVG